MILRCTPCYKELATPLLFSHNNLLMNDNIIKRCWEKLLSTFKLKHQTAFTFISPKKRPFSRCNLIQRDIYDSTIVDSIEQLPPLNGRRKSPFGLDITSSAMNSTFTFGRSKLQQSTKTNMPIVLKPYPYPIRGVAPIKIKGGQYFIAC